MTNPLLNLLDRWSRRHVDQRPDVPAGRPATVITGASEGIGLALAHRFAAGGHAVVLVARREALLATAADTISREHGVEAVPLPIDINEAGAAAAIEAAVAARGYFVDVLINNAGFGLSGTFETMPPEDIEALMSCNIVALTRLTRHFLPGMVARAGGGVINIASLAGLAPGPYQAAYYASKAYVISLTRAVRWENRGRGVRICVVTPGPVETGFHARMDAETSFYRYLVPSPTPQRVAASAWRGFRWHRATIAPGVSAKIVSLALRLVPNFLAIPAISWLLYPRGGETTTDVRGKTR